MSIPQVGAQSATRITCHVFTYHADPSPLRLQMLHRSHITSVFLITSLACGDGNAVPNVEQPDSHRTSTAVGPASQLPPNEKGHVPILAYHLFGDTEQRWQRDKSRFRRDLELLYGRGYRPVSVSNLVDGKLNLPEGMSPVVFTFDDASPSQFRYIETGGTLVVDSTSAVGIWIDFARTHPGWSNQATFCLLSGAESGRSFFGNRDIEGQKTEWRFRKVKWLAEQGFELCNHTLWHANLGKYDDAFVQEQIARGVLAIDSVIPGYRVRTFALPLGVWPKNRALASRGEWRDPRSGRRVAYDFDAILKAAGKPVPSPTDTAFHANALERVQVTGDELERVLDLLDRAGTRYVSAGPGIRH